jgi:LCP family protein required for cell wall assembly
VSDWSGEWFRDPKPRPPADGALGIGSEPTVSLPSGGAAGKSGAASNWPEQPPPRGGAATRFPEVQGSVPGYPGIRSGGGGRGSRGGGGRGGGGRGGGKRRLRPGRIVKIIGLLVVVLLVTTTGMYFYLNSKLTRASVLVNYAGRPVGSAGQNWLITGSDSRQGLTPEQQKQLATGSASDITGARSDTIMLLHIPSNGGPAVLVSLPRDSYLPIPGNGSNKLNTAFAIGGPKLLAETVQNATGLQINHYMGIGFGGLVNVVNSVGGVRMCLPSALVDPASGLNLKAGCQTLNGGEALGYVRTRHLFATQDLQREQDQRVFLKALLSKMTSPGTLLNPFAVLPATVGSVDALTVDQGAQLYQLAGVAFALRHAETTTVPIGSEPDLAVGDVVIWNTTQASELFNALKTDQPVPKSLLTGSSLAPAS